MAGQFLREGAHFISLRAEGAVHGERHADNNPRDFIFSNDIDYRANIRLDILPRENSQWGGNNTEGIAKGQSYAGIADIKS